MKLNMLRGSTGRIAWVFLPDSTSTVGAGKTALTNASAGLNVTVRREKSAAVTTYTGANIGTIATLGTWANPGTGKVNFKEVDSTNLPGIYELHFVDALFDTGDTSRWVAGMIAAAGVAASPFELALDAVDAQDSAAFGLSRLDAAISSRSTLGGTAQSGDNFARLGAPAGASIAADIAASFARIGAPVGASISADIAGIFTKVMTESYNADGSAPTPAQALFLLISVLTDFAIAGTLMSLHKLDGTNSGVTLRYDDAVTPSTVTRET